MAPADITAILEAIAELSSRVNVLAISLARIEEKTNVLPDHETRLREAEQRARTAEEAAAAANVKIETHAKELIILRERVMSMGKFTLPMVAKFSAAFLGSTVAMLAIVSYLESHL